MARKIPKKSQSKNKLKTKAKLRLSFTNCADHNLDMEQGSSSRSCVGIPQSADAQKTREVSDIVGISVINLDTIVDVDEIIPPSEEVPETTAEAEEIVPPSNEGPEADWTEVRGKKSPTAGQNLLQLTNEDVESEVQFWDTVVVCYVLGGNPPWESIEGFIRKIWGIYKFDKISFLPNGVFLERVKAVPIWLRLCGLPLKFWGKSSLEKLAGLLGKFLKRDGATEDKTRLGFARLLVEVEVGQAFPDKLHFRDEKGKEISILVEYEWKPSFCDTCKSIGHTKEMCKKRVIGPNPNPPVVKKIWRVIPKLPVTVRVSQTPKPPEVPFGGPTFHNSALITPVTVRQQVSRREFVRAGSSSPVKTYVEAITENSNMSGSQEQLEGRQEDPTGIGLHWEGINNNNLHNGGRVWVIWDPQTFGVTLIQKTAQAITVSVTELAIGDTFNFTDVYGSNDDEERNELWEHLREMHDQYKGREVTWARIANFKGCVNYCGLTDIKGQGTFFTWNNKQVPASRGFSRIDRFMVNADWLDVYPDGYAHFLPEGLFDHNPCVCYRRLTRMRRKNQFKYYNMWSLAPDFKNVVKDSWTQTVLGTLMYILVSKLKNLKAPLKSLNRNGFSDVDKAAGIARSLLEEIQIQLHNNPGDHVLSNAEREAADTYRHLCKVQYSFLSQKAKVDWLKFGDENTNTCDGIEKAFLDYYKSLLGTFLPTVPVHVPTVRTGRVVTEAPKLSNPVSVLDFRPIACCNTIYKTVAKVICKRLSRVLPDIVSESQGGFIKGRNFVENVLICQDLVRLYNRKAASPRCMIKIDLRKAYDSVEWLFLEQMMGALQFPQKFIDMVMMCVTSPSYSMNVNGNHFGFFPGKRGLRQGDPLSPLLFALCMEYLSRILGVVAQQDSFKFHPLCAPLRLNHLLIEDDLLLFCKGTDVSIMWMLRAFSTFSAASGLTHNKAKSEMYFNGVPTSKIDPILQVSGFHRGSLPFKYLGVPISSKRLSKNEGYKLAERIVARIRGWGAKHLSYTGRLTLVNAVLNNLHTYWASIFLIPSNIMNKITSICRNYLWSGSSDYKKVPNISWSTCCLPKNEGVLGIKEAKVWNKALLGNWSWKKLTHIMETFKQAYTNNNWLNTTAEYTVYAGYD
ncbi:uncharacterized protein LOC141631456 [Silene latifolia]|uniref:uncharacterized protein LOC141631456 n=1 Tax=Silene latifolia TaxID=37657 RepID=UPI003D78A6E2